MLKEIRESQSGLEQSAVFERIQKFREIQRGLEESTVLKAITASAVQAVTESAVAGGMQRNLIDSSSR